MLTSCIIFLLVGALVRASALPPYGDFGVQCGGTSCKCIPSLPCWPTTFQWSQLNTSVSGQLIFDTPLAISCYPGSQYSASVCASISSQWTNDTFQQRSPVGYCYPTIAQNACPPIAIAVTSSSLATTSKCSLGSAPVYTVNATSVAHVSAAVLFARQHNLRLVVRNTGHDLLGRSAGFGSLQVWVKYLRTGVEWQEKFTPSDGCKESLERWSGSAFRVGGGYIWSDVYPLAAARNVIVVGGGTPSVGVLGGWMQGGGHSPATHDCGLGADQVLEAQVVLASGQLVTANACQHPDLFFAIRGGGPSTYGIVVSTTIKAWPNTPVVAQTLAIAPLTGNVSAFLDALTDVYAAYPDLSDGGWSGYGRWQTTGDPCVGPFVVGYVHAIATMGKSLTASKSVFAPLFAELNARNDTLFVNVAYTELPDYWSFYKAFSGSEQAAGALGARGSRLLDRAALQGSRTALRATLEVLAGAEEEVTSNAVIFTGGGQVFRDAADPHSGVNPAWRRAYVHHVVARGWNQTTSPSVVAQIKRDITYRKAMALKTLAPDTGAYMNEADVNDPDWASNFYGSHFNNLSMTKLKYDGAAVFFCPTCVGSQRWNQNARGQLYAS